MKKKWYFEAEGWLPVTYVIVTMIVGFVAEVRFLWGLFA